MDPSEEEGCRGFAALAFPGSKLDLVRLDHPVCLFTGDAMVSALHFLP